MKSAVNNNNNNNVSFSGFFSGGHRGAGVSDVTSFTHAHHG